MKIHQFRLNLQNAVKARVTSLSTKKACLILAMAIAFPCISGFALSQLKTYTVTDGETTKTVVVSDADIDTVVTRAGFEVGENDLVKTNNETIQIIRRCALTIQDNGATKDYIVEQDTVSNVLKALGIEISDADILNYDLEALLPETATLTIDRVEYKTETTDKVISYAEYQKLLEKDGSLKVSMSEDQEGVYTQTYEYKLVNGEVTDKELISQSVKPIATTTKTTTTTAAKTTQATTQAVKQAAASVSGQYSSLDTISTLTPDEDFKLDANGVPVNYSKKIVGKGSAYSDYGATSTGVRTQPGYIAVDPNEIPYGTKMFIRSTDGNYVYGYAIAADTGGFIHFTDRVVDLFFYNESDCVNFGVRNVEIYILD